LQDILIYMCGTVLLEVLELIMIPSKLFYRRLKQATNIIAFPLWLLWQVGDVIMLLGL